MYSQKPINIYGLLVFGILPVPAAVNALDEHISDDDDALLSPLSPDQYM